MNAETCMQKSPETGQLAVENSVEIIEINDETGEINGWCSVLRDLGMLECSGNCEKCYCG